MSLFRVFFAALVACVIAFPVFAEDEASAATTEQTPAVTTEQATTTTTTATTTSTEQQSVKLNLNKATAKELMKVKGLNASKARAIVAYRKKHGEFKSVQELENVKGFKKIAADKMQDIQNQLTIE